MILINRIVVIVLVFVFMVFCFLKKENYEGYNSKYNSMFVFLDKDRLFVNVKSEVVEIKNIFEMIILVGKIVIDEKKVEIIILRL